jgi:hypothetical protein
MSSSSCVSMYGIRFSISDDDELAELEERTHKLFKLAKNSGLTCYWGNFGMPDEVYYAFIGRKIGIHGVENDKEVSYTKDELNLIMEDVGKKILGMGFKDEPKLYIQWMPDV